MYYISSRYNYLGKSMYHISNRCNYLGISIRSRTTVVSENSLSVMVSSNGKLSEQSWRHCSTTGSSSFVTGSLSSLSSLSSSTAASKSEVMSASSLQMTYTTQDTILLEEGWVSEVRVYEWRVSGECLISLHLATLETWSRYLDHITWSILLSFHILIVDWLIDWLIDWW